jgi:hypothetical protein
MTCGYSGRFAGPKRRWQIQAVIVMASMKGTAVGRLSTCRHPTGALPLPAQDQIARKIGHNKGVTSRRWPY